MSYLCMHRRSRSNPGAPGDVIPEWTALLDRVREVFDAHLGDEDTAELEEKSLAIFWPVLEQATKSATALAPDVRRATV